MLVKGAPDVYVSDTGGRAMLSHAPISFRQDVSDMAHFIRNTDLRRVIIGQAFPLTVSGFI